MKICNVCSRSDIEFYAGNASTCKGCVKARRLRRYAANRDVERAAMRRYNKATRAERTAAECRWREENAERARQAKRRRKARRRAREAAAFVEDVDPQVVWERDEGVCGICGEPADREDWHLDHVVPLVAGGEHSYANVQVAHPICNLQKGVAIEAREKVLIS